MNRPLPVLTRGDLTLRPLQRRDERDWLELRRRNRQWLRPWEVSTPPSRQAPAPVSFAAYVRTQNRDILAGKTIALAIEYRGELAGRVTLSGIEWGSECGASLGYWVGEEFAGRGIAPTAVTMMIRYGFTIGLHRVEVAVRPENIASLRVATKLGLREEGRRGRYLYIDGDWRDHLIFAITAEEPRRGRFWDTQN